MRVERVEWERRGGDRGGDPSLCRGPDGAPDVSAIGREVAEGGDSAVLAYTARFDATDTPPERLAVDPAEARRALERLDSSLRASLELAAGNIRRVAEAQVSPDAIEVRLPEGQEVTIREVPVGAAGVYAPGGRASYPSSVLMCALPARAAGVERVALASPPGPDGSLDQAVLAAAAIAGVDEIFAMGGAQAVFALAYGTESVAPVDVIVGPGNAWVQEAKRAVYGRVGIDSYAGPSELMALLGHDGDARWAALDLCAQAEHGGEGLLVAASVEEAVLDAVAESLKQLGAERPGLDEEALVSLVRCPTSRTAWRSPMPSLPSTSSCSTRTGASPSASGPPAASSWAAMGPRRSATTRRAPITCCPRVARGASPARSAPALPAPHIDRGGLRRGGGETCPARRHARPRRGLPGPRRVGDD